MFKLAIPVLHVTSSEAAEQFYCKRLGFTREFAYRSDGADPCYIGLRRDNSWIHISSFPGDAVAGGVVYLLVEDVDVLHASFVSQGVVIDLEPTDQPWGNREMYVKDSDGNCIRFVADAA